MKLILIFIALLYPMDKKCKLQDEFIIIKNFSYGKNGLSYDELNFIVKKFKLRKCDISSAIYLSDSIENKVIPINGKAFNFNFFGDNSKEILITAKLNVASYYYKGKKKLIALRIQ